ncbi:MAG: hypothetical protein WCP73_08790 [Eubacteriales bacterium]
MGNNLVSRAINAVIAGGYFLIKRGAILGLPQPIGTTVLAGTRWQI